MSVKRRWLPGKREDQLAMARQWNEVLTVKATTWGVPAVDVDELELKMAEARDALLVVNNKSTCTPVAREKCRSAFEAFIRKMRYVKKHYFLVPPLTNADLVSLGLHPDDVEPTEIRTPTAQPEGDIAFPGIHLVEMRNIRASTAGTAPDAGSEYGVKIYYGLTGTPTETHHFRVAGEPKSGHELPDHEFTRKKRYLFDFDGESGNTVYFCLRYENAKGHGGPFGPIMKAVVP